MTDGIIAEQASRFVSLMPKLWRRLFALDMDDPTIELPVAQLRVCSILRDEMQSMSAISRELGITHSAMTQIADRLEKAGLVERVCEPEDRRVKCLKLTAHGQDVMNKRREKRLQRIAEIFGHLTPGERDELMEALYSLWDASCISSNDPDVPVTSQPEPI